MLLVRTNMDMLRLKEHALLAALLVACALAPPSGTAQPMPPGESYDYMAGAGSQQPPQQDVQVSTTMIALLAGAVAVFVFIALSIIYLRHCTSYYDSSYAADRSALPAADVSTFLSRRWQLRQQRGTTASTRGLAKEVVEAFPTMRYAEARALRVGKERQEALECAVCLSEFEDEERLRLLPRCSHAFHPDCIGAWLASHVTCPVCRSNLDPDKDPGSDDEPSLIVLPPPAAAEPNNTHSHSASSEIAAVVVVGRQNDDDVAIDVAAELEEAEAEQRRKEALELQRIGTQQRRAMRSRSSMKARQLLRSHSTGHDSLAAAARLGRRDDMERFTLRLPEHVRREMMAASSWDQLSTRRGQKTGGGRRGLPGTGRWPSFFACTRTWSGRLPVFLPTRRAAEQSSDGGEVSSTSSSRIRGKRVAAADVIDGGAFAVGAADRIAAAGGGKVGSVAIDVDHKATSRQVRT